MIRFQRFIKAVLAPCLLTALLTSCDILAPVFAGPEGFYPSLVWLQPAVGAWSMDVSVVGNIISLGDVAISSKPYTSVQVFSPNGERLYSKDEYGYAQEVIANYSSFSEYSIGVNAPAKDNTTHYISVLQTAYNFTHTNYYARYNTSTMKAENGGGKFADLLQPKIASGAKERKFIDSGHEYAYSSAWMIGSFCDRFQPFHPSYRTQDGCPTFGKADCFVMRRTEDTEPFDTPITSETRFPIPVRHQWGGPENDLAYDIASDSVGNATIFLRAGSDFAITSATQTMVKMTVGYNIVRLDTNGLLTATYPVRLEAQGEISDTKIALAPNNVVYITAKDEQQRQYFLAKVTPSGTAWIRYFNDLVSTGLTLFYNYRSRMDLTTDSRGNVYITGSYGDKTDFGNKKILEAPSLFMAFVAKFSPTNECLGALSLGEGTGMSVRLSPDENYMYVNGWSSTSIMGVAIPDPNDNLPTRDRVFRSPAFLVKLRIR